VSGPLAAALMAASAALAPHAGPAPAGHPSGWLRLRRPQFELVTDASPARAEAAAARLTRFRQVLERVAPVPPLDTADRALVIAYTDESDFEAVRPRHQGRAHAVDGFVQGGGGQTLVAVNLAPGPAGRLETLDHEYVHLALNGALPAQPLWVAEGLAVLYSDWRADALTGAVRVGAVRLPEVLLLIERGLLPMERILAAGYTTPEFLDAQTRPVLYAQSWALVRLLLEGGDPRARERLLAFLSALGSGVTAPEAFEAAFGFGLREAEARLRRSLVDGGPPAIDAGLVPEAPPGPAAESAPPGLVAWLDGELLRRQQRDAEARRHFEAALAQQPGMTAAHEALAHLALRRGRWDEARRHLDSALRQRPEDPVALVRMAELLMREASARQEILTGESETAAAEYLERALRAAPYDPDAVLLLVGVRPEPRSQRIRMVQEALARHPGRSDLALTLAGLHLGALDPAAAAAALVRAREGTQDDTHRFLAEHLLRRLNEMTAGTAEATGRLLSLECRKDGALDFLVDAPARRLRLRAATPDAVLMQDGAGDPLQPELICGPQRATVRVRYRRLAEPAASGPRADGALLTLRFLSGSRL
jgi:tetratricopeptide (TPR) repeat protein